MGRRRWPYRPGVARTTNNSEPGILVGMPRLRGGRSSRVIASTASPVHITPLIPEQHAPYTAKEPGPRVTSNPKQLRQMHAALRRLRAILEAFRDMRDAKWVASLACRASLTGSVRYW